MNSVYFDKSITYESSMFSTSSIIDLFMKKFEVVSSLSNIVNLENGYLLRMNDCNNDKIFFKLNNKNKVLSCNRDGFLLIEKVLTDDQYFEIRKTIMDKETEIIDALINNLTYQQYDA